MGQEIWKVRYKLIYAPQVKYVKKPIFTKLAFYQWFLVKNFYTQLNENPTNGLIADARSRKDGCNLHIGFLFYFFTEHLKLLRREQFNDRSRRENTTWLKKISLTLSDRVIYCQMCRKYFQLNTLLGLAQPIRLNRPSPRVAKYGEKIRKNVQAVLI